MEREKRTGDLLSPENVKDIHGVTNEAGKIPVTARGSEFHLSLSARRFSLRHRAVNINQPEGEETATRKRLRHAHFRRFSVVLVEANDTKKVGIEEF
jgi:hypothetical protein